MLSEAEEKKRRLKELKGSSNPEDKEKAKRILWGGEFAFWVGRKS